MIFLAWNQQSILCNNSSSIPLFGRPSNRSSTAWSVNMTRLVWWWRRERELEKAEKEFKRKGESEKATSAKRNQEHQSKLTFVRQFFPDVYTTPGTRTDRRKMTGCSEALFIHTHHSLGVGQNQLADTKNQQFRFRLCHCWLLVWYLEGTEIKGFG